MKKFCTLLVLLFATTSYATIVGTDYYPQVFQQKYHKLHDQELKEELFKILDGLHIKVDGSADLIASSCPAKSKCYSQLRNISYKTARVFLFGKLHLKGNGNSSYVEDVYCNNRATRSNGAGAGKIPDPKVQNCEHTWPQSQFVRSQDTNLQKTDLHHLYPVDSRANSTRSNNQFGNVSGVEVHENCADSQKGVILGTNIKGFEPPDAHKGNVARALFYFSVRFKGQLSSEYTQRLKRWNDLDPVDDFERQRNEMIYEIQGTRNPFIDDPELAEQISDF